MTARRTARVGGRSGVPAAVEPVSSIKLSYCDACRSLMRLGRRVFVDLDPLLPEIGAAPTNRQTLLIEAREHARDLIQHIEDGRLALAREQLHQCEALLQRAAGAL